MRPISPLRVALLAALLLALAPGRGRAFVGDAGASTFESAAKRYPERPHREVRLEDIPVPQVQVEAPEPAAVTPPGPTFPIDRFEVVGNTLLTPEQVRDALEPFRGEDETLADVQKARDALQNLYAADGFLTVAVVIPQQTVEGGKVRLEVVEARVGRVEVRNAGVHWFSDASILRSTPNVRPGAVLRREDLEADIRRANANPDLQVRPLLEAGKEAGKVDVALVADDRIPLHGDFEFNNIHTPGSPKTRFDATLSYTNLWGLGHAASVLYEFAPNPDRFDDVQIWAGTYRAPMPWDPEQQLFAYVARSDTSNAAAGAGGISLLGKGLNMGARYRLPLPSFGVEGFHQAFTVGFDRKDVTNTVSESSANIETPILYVPLVFAWEGSLAGKQAFTGLRLGLNLNRAGWFGGDNKDNFQRNRGGVTKNNDVDGNYEIYTASLQNTTRIPAILRTLAAGRFVDLPAPEGSMLDDWTVAFAFRGQLSNQPLISTEQFGAGGPDTVRGYLDRELFGDWAYNTQLELRTPSWQGFFGGRLDERLQLFGFWDYAYLWTLKDPATDPGFGEHLQSIGLGLRASLLGRIRTEVILGDPLRETQDTKAGHYRVDFRVGVGL